MRTRFTARGAKPGPRAGFTLLESVIALAILALALMAIFDLNSGAVAMHAYAKKVTVATLLARSKMTDLEQDLYDKGFPADDEDRSGDFSDEGWSSFKWRAKIIAPKTQGVSTDQLLSAVFNIPMDGSGGGLSGLMSMFGGQAAGKDGSGALPPGATAGMSGLASGAMSGMAQQQLTQFLDQIAKAVREVHLTVTWRDGKQVESVDLVTHVVSLGQNSDRNGGVGQGANASGAAPGSASDSTWVDPTTGQPVPNAQPGPNGTYVNPANPYGPPLVRGSQFNAQGAGALGTGQLGSGITGPPVGRGFNVPGYVNQ